MGRSGSNNPLDGPLSPIQDVSPSLEAAEQESMRYSQVNKTCTVYSTVYTIEER